MGVRCCLKITKSFGGAPPAVVDEAAFDTAEFAECKTPPSVPDTADGAAEFAECKTPPLPNPTPEAVVAPDAWRETAARLLWEFEECSSEAAAPRVEGGGQEPEATAAATPPAADR